VSTFTANTNGINPAYRSLYLKLVQPVMQHLREKGWMDKDYISWIDEPTELQTALVQDGMNMMEELAPDMPRALAKLYAPAPELYDYVTLWWPCWGTGMQYNSVKPRQAAGDEIWYYVATVPKAPWPNNFIDQPAICPRIRHWYGESFGFQGEVYYGINYYLGNPNPWLDGMSSTGPSPQGITYWGNGDGTMVYPPVKTIPTNAVISGPVDSIRWESTREGLEDREYFWSLSRTLAAAETRLGTNHPAVLEGYAARAAGLAFLSWYPEYPFEVDTLLGARERIALAIEALDDGAPFFAKNPLSKVVAAGKTETLRVEVVGWPQPSIQWQHAGTNLPGANAVRLALPATTPEMAGEYRVIISNSVGISVSPPATLTVLVTNQAPFIVKSPDSITRTNGGRAVFGVGASSLTPIRYQWLRDDVAIAGATNITLALSNVNYLVSGSYTVIASNAFGATISSPGLLFIQTTNGTVAPSITSQPAGQSVFTGQNVQFTVSATGTPPLAYHWYFNSTNPISGGSNAVLALNNVQLPDAGSYHVVIANGAGAVTSSVATLTVQSLAPFITAQPTNQSVVPGLNALFAVTADGTAPLGFQWFFNNTNLLAGANASSLTITNVQPAQAGSYVVRITNTVGAVTSAPALLQLEGMPNYTGEPPGMSGYKQGTDLVLSLAPDNRNRTVLVSTNLLDWQPYSTNGPSSAFVQIPISTTNGPSRYFRLVIGP